jgi:hypothetical protein
MLRFMQLITINCKHAVESGSAMCKVEDRSVSVLMTQLCINTESYVWKSERDA